MERSDRQLRRRRDRFGTAGSRGQGRHGDDGSRERSRRRRRADDGLRPGHGRPSGPRFAAATQSTPDTCGCCSWSRRWWRWRASGLLEAARLQADNELLQAEINLDHNMVGRSRPMRTLFDRIARVARTDIDRCCCAARAEPARSSSRAPRTETAVAPTRPFIAINCAAHHRVAARVGAVRPREGRVHRRRSDSRKGKLELADGGTLFLDEIGELPLDAAGEAAARAAGARVRARRRHATRPRRRPADRRDQPRSRGRGQGRHVPPGSLLPAQRRHARACRRCAIARTTSAAAGRVLRAQARAALRPAGPRPRRRTAVELLARHDWPGNVRELENVVEQALALGTGERDRAGRSARGTRRERDRQPARRSTTTRRSRKPSGSSSFVPSSAPVTATPGRRACSACIPTTCIA